MTHMSELTVKVNAFEGPLDLLLHLIKTMEIDITDIPIVEIVNQYMAYLQEMEKFELNIAGEYLVMATTLLSIKSSMLLPQAEVEEEEDEVDPRDELVLMLLEYQAIKEASESLQGKEMDRKQYVTKPATELVDYQNNIPLQPGEVTLFDLLVAYQRVTLTMTFNEPQEHTIEREEISVEDKIAWIRQQITQADSSLSFSTLLRSHSRHEIVTTFLALLELIREQEIQVHQDNLHEELTLSFVNESQGV